MITLSAPHLKPSWSPGVTMCKEPWCGESVRPVAAQQFNILTVDPASGGEASVLYYGERSRSAPDGLKSHIYSAWVPLSFGADGAVLPMTYPASFEVEL